MAAPRRTVAWLTAASLMAGAGAAAHYRISRQSGLVRTVFGALDPPGSPLHTTLTTAVDLRFLSRYRHLPRRFFRVRWEGVWWVPADATYTIHASADDRVTVVIDQRRVLDRRHPAGGGSAVLALSGGPHAILVDYEQQGAGAFLNLRISRAGEQAASLPARELFPSAPTPATRHSLSALRVFRTLAWGGALAAAVPLLRRLLSPGRRWFGGARLRFALGLTTVVVLGTGLRLDALLARYGPLEGPRWASELQIHAADRLAALRPDGFHWISEPKPYVGGDPITYLRFAREMRHFYAAHVREPLFVYTTRVWLTALDNQDVAISFASLTFSVLLVIATYLLGAAAFSKRVGLGAALAIAIEREAVSWSVDGWRDDAFAAFVALFAWALVRSFKAPTMPNALLAGVIGAAACLTRLSSLTFIVLGVGALIIRAARRSRRAASQQGAEIPPTAWASVRAVSIALFTTAVVIAPYVINCWREFGDPFYAVNYHTRFYQAREERARYDVSASGYVASKIVQQPLRSLRIGAIGLTTYPFVNKWTGFDPWIRGAGWLLSICAAIGLLLWIRTDIGCLLLVVLEASLLPYALTWPIRGGAEWRFTMHAYPFYLIAAMTALSRQPPGFGRAASVRRRLKVRHYVVGALVAAFAAIMASRWWSWLEFREAVNAREPAAIEFGERDGAFLLDGWSSAERSGDRRIRYAIAVRAGIRIPLPEERSYRLRLRLDPFEAERSQRISVFLNGTPLGAMAAGGTSERDGWYEFTIPSSVVRRGTNRLELLATHLVPVATLRSRAAGLEDDQSAAFRMWNLTVLDSRAP